MLKYDTIFDRAFFYDRHLIGVNNEDHIKVTGFINMIQLPLMWMLALFRGESMDGYFNIFNHSIIYKDNFNQDYLCIIVMVILSVLLLLKPHIDFNIVRVQGNKEKLFITDIFAYLFFTAFAIVFVDPTPEVSLFEILAFVITLSGYSLQFIFRNTI